MSPQRTVLLLNASNMVNRLTYPYAFVQVSEIADRFNIRAIRRDMIGIPKIQWEGYLKNLLTQTAIDMVLITVRNTDTFGSEDYQFRNPRLNYHQRSYMSSYKPVDYYPIETTRHLIKTLRKLTPIPIVTGGYAFSIMPEKLMNHLQPDYGVIGGPDAFFEHFDDILEQQNLDKVANLVYPGAQSLQKGPMRFFPPAPRQEYTNTIINDRYAFYSRFFPRQDVKMDLNVPIEVVRGCLMNCTYCSEPLVKGRELRYRDLDVIEDEINFLSSHGLYHFDLVCSEINTGGNEFVMNLADRILRINEQRNLDEKVYWSTYYLMNLSQEELKHFRKAGFLGGANDVVSLDDTNLTAIKAPCTSRTIINHIIGVQTLIDEEYQQNSQLRPLLEERIFKCSQDKDFKSPENFMDSWNFFLGNTAITPQTIRITLKAVDDVGLAQRFDNCFITKATRVFDYQHPDDDVMKYTWSMTDQGLADSYNELYPSFVYPPVLLHHFGNPEVLIEFFALVGKTYLSCNHLFRKEWNWFLANNIDSITFLTWWNIARRSDRDLTDLTTIPEVLEFLRFLQNNPSPENLTLLFNPTPERKPLMNFAAHIAIRFVLFAQETDLVPVLNILGMPSNLEGTFSLSPYKIAVTLFRSFADKEELLAALNMRSFNNVLSRFFIEYLIYLNNMPFQPEYQIFFKNSKS